ncbi:MAG: sodium:solute symporter family protein [Akkermansiaceae bacterium]|nr:sodium:solute symporter family protein [Akkermansiaceae bacterium]
MSLLAASVDLGTLPYYVLVAYLLLLLGLGVASFLKSRGAENVEADYYLAGRGQGLLVTSLTIMATYFSGFAILTFPGWVYSDGIAPMLFALNLPVAAAGIYVIGNRIRKLGQTHGHITPADLISHHYGDSALLRFLVALVGALYVIPYVMIQIKAGGILAQGLFQNVEHLTILGQQFSIEDTGIAVLSLVTMLYVLLGGMRSVAWTDVVQGLLLLSAMLLSGVAIVYALGGVGGYFEEVSKLDGKLLTMPAVGERFNAWSAVTFCAFASLASIVQPAQWMRFYSARSSDTLRKTAIVFSTVLPVCFLLGVFLVGLGGRALYPMIEGALPEGMSKPDDIVIHVISQQFPEIFGSLGHFLIALILVAVMAASMSTADSNLHALSAVVTRDLYHPLRPGSSEKERAWVGRAVIVLATVVAAGLTYWGAQGTLLKTITTFFFMAMAFSAQLLPLTIDILFLKKGTRQGAIAGLAAGTLTVFLFPPLGSLILGDDHLVTLLTADLKTMLDVGFCGIFVNTIVFVTVSRFTRNRVNNHTKPVTES